jgi:hypothetical protein
MRGRTRRGIRGTKDLSRGDEAEALLENEPGLPRVHAPGAPADRTLAYGQRLRHGKRMNSEFFV